MSSGPKGFCDTQVSVPSNFPHQMELVCNKAFDHEFEYELTAVPGFVERLTRDGRPLFNPKKMPTLGRVKCWRSKPNCIAQAALEVVR